MRISDWSSDVCSSDLSISQRGRGSSRRAGGGDRLVRSGVLQPQAGSAGDGGTQGADEVAGAVKGKVAALAVVLIAAPLVIVSEGVITGRYNDPVGIPTACVGETNSEIVSYKAQFSRDECIAVMGASLFAHAVELDKCVKRPLGRNEAEIGRAHV